MELRRQDERRRRALLEETGRSAVAPEELDPAMANAQKNATRSPARKYSESALTERQPSVVDLIPQRPIPIAAFVLLGLVFVGGLPAIHANLLPKWQTAGITGLEAFDLTQPGGVAGWFAAICLGLSAAGSGIVYSIRRHRNDDYAGRYRLWSLTSLLLIGLSLDAVTSLHRVVPVLMTNWTGTRLLGDGRIWWLASYGLLMTGFGFRLAREMRGSLAAVLTFAATLLCYATVASVELGWLPRVTGLVAVLVQSTASLLGHLLLLISVAVYARHELAVAQGRIVPRVRKKKRKTKRRTEKAKAANDTEEPRSEANDSDDSDDDREEDEDDDRRVDAAHATPAPHTKQPAKPAAATVGVAANRPALQLGSAAASAASKTSEDGANEDDDDDDDDGDSGLSRAERRRLKKLKKREQRK